MNRNNLPCLFTALALFALGGCGQPQEEAAPEPQREASAAPEPQAAAAKPAPNPLRNAYFGDLHVHTTLSMDAYVFGTRTTPDDAYRFAKGEAILHPSGRPLQLRAPLDFQAVTDHAGFLGTLRAMADPNSSLGQHELSAVLREADTPSERADFFVPLVDMLMNRPEEAPNDPEVNRQAWQEVVEAAQRHNDPGHFTTFIGYEYTSSGPEFQNLHRNVIFAGGQPPPAPFSAGDSTNPEDLWDWMDAQRAAGREALAIPHNSNGSDGWMFEKTLHQSDRPMDAAYAEQRMRNEPLVENTQVKGTSDTHPALSPNDEWANFEIMDRRVGSMLYSQPMGSYVREAWLNGLAMQETQGFNPYRFGVIGSSDSHVSGGSFREDDYWAKLGLLDAEPILRGSVPIPELSWAAETWLRMQYFFAGNEYPQMPPPNPDGSPNYVESASHTYGAAGLAAVWAEENTRASIFKALQRKETFSTTGPRILLRFFAGYGLPEDIAEREDAVAAADAGGVPMGAELWAQPGEDAAPAFFAWVARAADSAPLERLQIIKGWMADGAPQERVYDVACANGAAPDPVTHRCPAAPAALDLTTCEFDQEAGAAVLSTRWQDPEFDPGQSAFYYARALEIPTCRWSTWDAIRAGVAPRADLPASIQERAWSSPIWRLPPPAQASSLTDNAKGGE